jgi:hypothetical protein
VDLGAALAHQDVAAQHELPVGALHAEALRMAVAAVARRADALFVGEQFAD